MAVRVKVREGGLGHIWAAMPWAEQAASVAGNNKVSMRDELRAKAACTAERTADSTLAGDETIEVLAASTSTSTVMGDRDWARLSWVSTSLRVDPQVPSSWETAAMNDPALPFALTTRMHDNGTRESCAKALRRAQTNPVSLMRASGLLPLRVRVNAIHFGTRGAEDDATLVAVEDEVEDGKTKLVAVEDAEEDEEGDGMRVAAEDEEEKGDGLLVAVEEADGDEDGECKLVAVEEGDDDEGNDGRLVAVEDAVEEEEGDGLLVEEGEADGDGDGESKLVAVEEGENDEDGDGVLESVVDEDDDEEGEAVGVLEAEEEVDEDIDVVGVPVDVEDELDDDDEVGVLVAVAVRDGDGLADGAKNALSGM